MMSSQPTSERSRGSSTSRAASAPDGARHHLIRADDDRRRRVGPVDELGHGSLGGVGREFSRLDDAVRLGEAPQRELGLEADPPLARWSHGRPEDEVDATMPEVEEVPDRRPHAVWWS